MGKRKFKKPEDSDSEYEWEEAKPKIRTEPEVKQSRDDDLSGFLDKYTSKSRNEIRKENNEREKDKEAEVYENRLYKSTESISTNFDSDWLRKSFNRCKQQSINDGVDLMTLLKDRYDTKTIDFMMNNFSGSSKKMYDKVNNKYEKYLVNDEFNKKYEKSSNDVIEERYVIDSDINEACASLMKAEMLGNTKKVLKLQKQINTLREAQKRKLKIRLTRQRKNEDDAHEEHAKHQVLLEKSLKSGKIVPYFETRNQFVAQTQPNESKDRKLCDLIREEKMTTADESDLAFARMTAKLHHRTKDRDEITESEYTGRIGNNSSDKRDSKFLAKSKQSAISAQKYRTSQVSNCIWCYERIPKHLVLSRGSYFCLIVPRNLGLIDYHLQIVPIDHVAATTQINDEDMWNELLKFKKLIVEFFLKELSSETVFLEMVMNLGKFPHTVIDCIPVSQEVSISLFFKKSIDEAKSEWCVNRGLLDLKNGDIRRTVPREFPYFSVGFDLDSGFAFVIENEKKISPRFGLDIVGSILGLNEIDMSARRRSNGFSEQFDLCLRIEKRWKPYDLWQRPSESDDSD